jgi:Carotenoid biosynthesis protein
MYLILEEALWPWLRLPALGNIGFTVVFVLFALFHCIGLEGLRRTAPFFVISAIVCYSLEEIGVRTGLIYGAYHYSALLGPRLGHVPLIIPLAYFMMIYPSWMVARTILRGIDTRSIPGFTALSALAALVMTAWDVVMDPGMAAAGNWIWERAVHGSECRATTISAGCSPHFWSIGSWAGSGDPHRAKHPRSGSSRAFPSSSTHSSRCVHCVKPHTRPAAHRALLHGHTGIRRADSTLPQQNRGPRVINFR